MGATTATWDNANKWLSFTAGQIGQSTSIRYNDGTISSATLTATIDSGSFDFYMSADGGTNWESVSNGVTYTFANTGTDLRWKIVENASSTGKITKIVISGLVTPTPSTLLTGILAYWKMDETSGTVTSDSVGTYNGTVNSGVNINQTGKINKAYDFTNTGFDTVEFGDVPISTDMTINFWINKSTLPTGEFIFNKYTSNYDVGLYIESGALVHFSLFPVGTPFNPSSLYDSGVWTMITLKKTGTTWEIFKNGVSKENIIHISGTAQTDFRFGNRGAGGDVFGLSANLDEFGIWNRALSNTEITDLFNGGTGLSYPF